MTSSPGLNPVDPSPLECSPLGGVGRSSVGPGARRSSRHRVFHEGSIFTPVFMNITHPGFLFLTSRKTLGQVAGVEETGVERS